MVLRRGRKHQGDTAKRRARQGLMLCRRPGLMRMLRTSSKDTSLVVSDPLSAGLSPSAFRKYEMAMKNASRKNVIPGCASVVLKMGEVVQARAFGFADLEARRAFRLDTICRVFCVTKTFVLLLPIWPYPLRALSRHAHSRSQNARNSESPKEAAVPVLSRQRSLQT